MFTMVGMYLVYSVYILHIASRVVGSLGSALYGEATRANGRHWVNAVATRQPSMVCWKKNNHADDF